MTVLVAGGGIAGLAMALTCHQLGVPVKVFESSSELKPLGVGINLQPNAIRELFELGLEADIENIGIRTRSFGLYSKMGKEIWIEPRGTWAGYNWPQYSVHRGELQMMLYRKVVELLGDDAVQTDSQVTGFENTSDGVEVTVADRDGNIRKETGDLLIAADGVHSAVRAQMFPHEGEPKWGGAILWRSTTLAKPFGDGATMAMIGHETQRVVTYPISNIDPQTGFATINWIAERTIDPAAGFKKEDYSRQVDRAEFLPEFENWRYDWLDIPELVNGSGTVFEYPMVDRDPLPKWTNGRVTLMGDAAHVMYPTGSNGASQAIVDARKIGRAFLDHGVCGEALEAYENEMRPVTEKIILANRSKGPDSILQIVEDRCGGQFDDIEKIIPKAEMAAFAANYKATAGFGIEALNKQPSIIPAGSKVGS